MEKSRVDLTPGGGIVVAHVLPLPLLTVMPSPWFLLWTGTVLGPHSVWYWSPFFQSIVMVSLLSRLPWRENFTACSCLKVVPPWSPSWTSFGRVSCYCFDCACRKQTKYQIKSCTVAYSVCWIGNLLSFFHWFKVSALYHCCLLRKFYLWCLLFLISGFSYLPIVMQLLSSL